jgi:ubiquinone/menaquinone biosynthesis C-methylase UbiE
MNQPRIADTWEQGSSYERYIGRWSRQVAPAFLAWLGRPPGLHWLDVGCGTGALLATIVASCEPASVAGVEPSEGFRESARRNLGGAAKVLSGTAAEIPLEDGSVDVVVSGLVLNFVPDPANALTEMKRVSCGGGTVAAYVWDYAGKMEYLRAFWDAAAALDPAAASLDEGARFSLCRAESLRRLFETAGLHAVQTKSIDVSTRFADFEDYWQPYLGGQGPAPSYVMSLDENARARLRETLRERLAVADDGSLSLIARAWAVRGST